MKIPPFRRTLCGNAERADRRKAQGQQRRRGLPEDFVDFAVAVLDDFFWGVLVA